MRCPWRGTGLWSLRELVTHLIPPFPAMRTRANDSSHVPPFCTSVSLLWTMAITFTTQSGQCAGVRVGVDTRVPRVSRNVHYLLLFGKGVEGEVMWLLWWQMATTGFIARESSSGLVWDLGLCSCMTCSHSKRRVSHQTKSPYSSCRSNTNYALNKGEHYISSKM